MSVWIVWSAGQIRIEGKNEKMELGNDCKFLMRRWCVDGSLTVLTKINLPSGWALKLFTR